MLRSTAKVLLAALAALALPVAAYASAVIVNKRGDVQSAIAPATRAPVADNQRIPSGATVSTASGGSATLRFDDGLRIALGENTTLTIVDYGYVESTPAGKNRAAFELQRGAVRVVTGYMVERHPGTFSLAAPQASITVREPTDFTVVLYNPMYLSVGSGSVVTANQAGRLALPQGSSISIAGANAVPVSVQAASLPSAASSALGNLQVAMVQAPGGAAAGAAAAGPWVAPTALAVSAAAIAAVAARSASAASATSHTPASHSCPSTPPAC